MSLEKLGNPTDRWSYCSMAIKIRIQHQHRIRKPNPVVVRTQLPCSARDISYSHRSPSPFHPPTPLPWSPRIPNSPLTIHPPPQRLHKKLFSQTTLIFPESHPGPSPRRVYLYMGKRLPSAASLEDYARAAAAKIRSRKVAKPNLRSLDSTKETSAANNSKGGNVWLGRGMDNGGGREGRAPLSEVVSDCVRRWFQDALKEAKAGDASMQVLVGQMYHTGYGVVKNEQKGRAWIEKASRYRSAVWKVGDKHPGYNASDSDSDEVKEDIK
ncbi:uncharacterized protein [Typha latifolia]|uniref:uncharacterized protein n=1 Tax=Typha latifolia TaxID=4733 RepID=UPI003C2E80E9